MAQESPLCRFCLDTTNEKKNPLIEPCGCRGSLRYVHSLCLSKWRRMNPIRNANTCLLCFVDYTLVMEDTLESIPDFKTVPIFFLRFPFFLCLTVYYFGIMYYSFISRYTRYKDFFEIQAYIYQAVYGGLFILMFKVKNKKMYMIHTLQPSTLLLVFGLFISNMYIRDMEYMSVVPITLCLGMFYMRHIHVLYLMNTR